MPGVLVRGLRFCECDVERGSSRDGFGQFGVVFRFAPAEMLGRGGRVRLASLSRLIERGG